MAEGRFFDVSAERLALLRERRRREGLERAEEAIPRRPEGEAPPPAFAQERLWFLDRLTEGRAGLVIPAALRLRGPLEPAALETALGDVVARHETLRSRFPERDGRPTVEVAPPAPAALPRVDLSALPPPRRRPRAEALAAALAGHPFDLARGPLWAALLVRLGDGDHALLLAVHHVAADGWSMGVLFRELAAAYEARAAGRPCPLAPPAVRYGDWAAWQRRRLSGQRLADEVAWWRATLDGAPRVLDLPADRPRAPARDFRGGTARAVLETPAADRLRALGRGLPGGEATPFMVLLAALAVLLARWCGQRDLVVGTPVAGRTRGEVEDLVGLFLNHLALRLDLSGTPSFRELLERVRRTCLDAFAHQELPFERLLDELEVPRDLATTPLFQVFLNVLNFPAPPRRPVGGLELSPLAPPRAPARFDLTLYADDRGPGAPLGLDLVYDARRFDAPRVEEALRQLAALVEAAAEDPGRPVDALPLLTAAARRRLPDPGRAQDSGWPGPVHAAVARHAAATPDAPAVLDAAGGAVSYARLHAAVEALAGRLAAEGVRRGDVVAVHAHREPALVAAVLAVHRAGAAFLLLDPAHPAPRNVLCLRRAAPRLLLRLAGAPPPAAQVTAGRGTLTLPPLTAADPWPDDAPPPPVPLTADDPAYVAFTSGSTGEPKGVVGLHRSLTHFLPWQAEAFSLTAADRVSLLSGLAHDPLHRDLFTPLWVGAAVAVPDGERFAEPGYLAGWARRLGVTVLHATPSLLRLLATTPGRAGVDDGGGDSGGAGPPLPALRWAFLLGEALTGADLARLAVLAPRAMAVNLYGTTETQRAVAWLRAEATEGAAVVPLGRGMPDVQLVVLPSGGERGGTGRAGVGELGEVAVRSPHLAAGYLDRPADTAAVFVPDPFGGTAGGRLYRTGDLGRYRPDGTVEPLGRRDRQVKVRGHRVEPGEIEAALAAHPAVAEAAVVAVESGVLAAYWVAAGDPDPGLDSDPDLRAFLAARLPVAMVPALFVPLPALPRTPNGKLDRAALPSPEPAAPSGAAGTPPATPTEELLAAVWAEVLDREDGDGIARETNFFAAGGHSLALTRVLARVREVLGVELPVRRAFEASTLAAQAAAVDEARREPDATPPLEPRREGGDAPVSFAQRRLWFLDRYAPGSSAYTLSATLHLDGALDLAALHRALTAVVARQGALRTTLPAPEGTPVQRVAPPAPVPLPRVDLAALPPEPRRREAARRETAIAGHTFDLARGPLLAVRLLRLAPDRHRLLVAVHHAVADGWSLEVLAGELAEHYSAALEDRPPRVPELPVSYADWAAWQRRVLDDDALEGEVAWWRRRLAGLPDALDLPTDRPRGAREEARGGSVERRLPAALGERLESLGRETGATRFMLLLAALALVLGRWSGQPTVAVGSPEAGRGRRETEPLVGLFLNLLVLPVDLSGAPTWRQLLARVRETVLGAFAHRDVPFERLIEELAPQRDPARHPLFEVLLNVLPAGTGTAARFAGLEARLAPRRRHDARFPLTLYAPGRGGWSLTLVYRRALFDPARAEELLDQVVAALEAMTADPERPTAGVSLLTARGRSVLADPAAPLPAPEPTPVADRFAEVAAEHPARPAVVAEEGSWSYRQLAAQVERRAGELEPWRGRVVAVQGPPCRDLAAATLAVLRAGAVLLLVDPALPEERRRRMLDAAGAAALLRLPGEGVEELPSDAPPLPPDAAYVVFTSGSTGAPKAVLGSGRGLAHFLDWQRATFGIGDRDRVAQLTALSFDVVLRDLLLPLTAGAALLMPDPELRLDPARVPAWLEVEGATVLHAVPTPVRAWLAEAPAVDLAALRWVFFAGEPLPAALVEDWRRAFPGSPSSAVGHDRGLVNLYGPTETTLARCFWPVPDPPAPGVQPVGRALPDSQALVLRDGRLCAPGEVGEIVLRTPCRSLGYLVAPEEDRRRFFPNPFRDGAGGEGDGDLLYASGDLGRTRLDGVLEILGRRDRQVKVRGVRVEPGEVEAALLAEPSVAAAVVDVTADGALAAWVVPAGEGGVEPRRLAASLARRLPPALVPSRWTRLDRLPTTATGKVDRSALPPPERPAPRDPRPPRNRLERELVEIFRRVLGVERVGVDDGFFELGGHSLRAVPLLSAVEGRLGVRLPLAALFQRPTVAELAQLVRAAGPVHRAAEPAAAGHGAASDPLSSGPLVTLQTGGDRPPLFLVHPGGGGVLCYADLARALGPAQPLHALQSVGLDGGEEPLTAIGAMAERYLEALEPVRPAGPWHLGGWSFGGRVAFEMARRLRRAGEEVGLLALLDITPDPSPGPAAARDDDDPALLARALADAFPRGAEAELAERLRGLDDEAQIDALLDAARAAGRLPEGVAPERARALFRVFKSNMAAARAFRQQSYPGEAVLFRAVGSDRFAADGDPTGGWGELAATVRVVRVPGDHHTLVRPPHVAKLAAALARELARQSLRGA